MTPKKGTQKGSARKFRRTYRAGKKIVKTRSDVKPVKHEEKKSESANDDRGSVPITPQMIRWAVKVLHTKRVFVSSKLIADHLQRCYPIESDPVALKRELQNKLAVAVCIGLITKCGADAYCLPTLRQQATARRSNFTVFWKTYNVIHRLQSFSKKLPAALASLLCPLYLATELPISPKWIQ